MTFTTDRKPKSNLKPDEIRSMLSDVAEKLYYRLSAERFTVKKTDAPYLSMVRTFINVVQELHTQIEGEEVEQIKKQLDDLEKHQTRKNW